MELQQIGLGHPRVKQVLDIQRNTAPNPRRLFVAEGLWAHNLVLETGAPVETFFWCPGGDLLGRGAQAQRGDRGAGAPGVPGLAEDDGADGRAGAARRAAVDRGAAASGTRTS